MPILKVKNPDGSWSDIPALIGPKGPKGDTGASGSNGFSIYTITGNVPMIPDKEGCNEVSREDIDNARRHRNCSNFFR